MDKLDSFTLEILQLCNGNNNVLEISKKIKMSYRATFLRLRKLNEQGIIKMESSGNIGESNKIILEESHKEELLKKIEHWQHTKEIFFAETKQHRKLILKYLNTLARAKNRYVSQYNLPASLELKEPEDIGNMALIEATLEELGATKSRVEITKWGKHILKEILKNPSCSIVTRSVGEDTKIKIKLMQEAEEYGRIETKKEIMEIIGKAEKIDGYVPDNQDLIKKIKQFIAGANE